jgi:hypothetical protein
VCAASDLRITNSALDDGAGGYLEGAMVLTNVASRDCVLDGFPGLELLSQDGTTISNAARHCAYLPCSTTATTVTLAPGQTAHFIYVWQDNPVQPKQNHCPQSATALVTPPNAYDHRVVPLRIAPCGLPPVLGVSTVQDGPPPAS